MAIVLRNTKGSALTHNELDGNFTDLNSRILDSAAVTTIARTASLDSAEAFQLLLDSSEIINLIDSSYINRYAIDSAVSLGLVEAAGYTKVDSANVLTLIDANSVDEAATIALISTHGYDSANTLSLVDSDYVQLRQSGGGGLDSALTSQLIDSSYVQLRQRTEEIKNDTSPQLGGDLDMGGKTITLRFQLGASGSDHYTFTDSGSHWFPGGAENDPTLHLRRGEHYIFQNMNGSGQHPFRIQSDSSGTAYNTGVTNNSGGGGTEIKFKVAMSAPDLLYYQCTAHSAMFGMIKVK